MKRQAPLLATIFFLLCTLFLLRITKTQAADAAIFGSALLRQGAIPVELTQQPTAAPSPTPSPLPSPSPSPTESPRPVPVTTVEEAWDEEARKTEPEPEPREISLGENATLELRNETDYAIDFSELPALPALTEAGEGPAVLIMHTHASESYAAGVEDQGTVFHTQDETKNVIAVGEVLAEELRAAGFEVIHDKTMCDVDFNSAYSTSRQVIAAALEENPSFPGAGRTPGRGGKCRRQSNAHGHRQRGQRPADAGGGHRRRGPGAPRLAGKPLPGGHFTDPAGGGISRSHAAAEPPDGAFQPGPGPPFAAGGGGGLRKYPGGSKNRRGPTGGAIGGPFAGEQR